MNRKKFFKIFLVIGAIFLLILPSIQGNFNKLTIPKTNESEEDININTRGSYYYQNCIVWVTGNCKKVWGALTWIFGFYCPLLKKHLWIQASGQENESLSVIVRGGGNFGTYYDHENILIELQGATGILYWFGKSIIKKDDFIIARCKADHCWITT